MPARPDDPSSPYATWDGLAAELRSEVVTLARSGTLHPDHRVRRLAWEWARGEAGQRTWLVVVAASLTAASGGQAGLRGEFRRRDEARAIVALGAPPRTG